jgi:hypothetical protein
MSSELKSETARINGAKSHGPVTPEGKARSSANSRRHGLTASVLLAAESDEHLQLLLADFMDQFHPQTGVETDLVEAMAISRWRLRRLLGIETHLFDLEVVRRRQEIDADFTGMDQQDRLAFAFQKLADKGNSLALLIRYEGSLNRSYDKAFKQLQQLQSTPPLGSFRIPAPEPETPPPPPPAAPASPRVSSVDRTAMPQRLLKKAKRSNQLLTEPRPQGADLPIEFFSSLPSMRTS